MSATTPAPSAPESRPPFQTLLRRWPTALALLLSVPGMVSGGSGGDRAADSVETYGEALPLLPLLYLIVHQLGKPRLTWPVVGAGLASIVALRTLDLVSPSVPLTVVALFALVLGAVRGTPHGPVTFRIQAAGALVFCTLALVGLAVDPDLGRYLVAAGWFFHGVWDFAHLMLNRLEGIVSRTFAEWCGVIDVCIGIELAFLL
jgi:hypothetical protein